MLDFLAALARLFLRPNFDRRRFRVDQNGMLRGLSLTYVGRDDIPYGKSASAMRQPYAGLVAHHPASHPSWSVQQLIDLTLSPRGAREVYYGYHFIIDVDGTIYQTAPLTKRTNHIKDKLNRQVDGATLTNRNALGLCFHLASHNPDMAPTKAQREAGKRLVQALRQLFGALPIYGHGEIQTDKHPSEGRAFARFIRSNLK